MVAMNQVESPFEIIRFILLFLKNGLKIRGVTAWYQSVRCENLGLWGDFCLNGLHVVCFVIDFGIRVHEHLHCIDIDP